MNSLTNWKILNRVRHCALNYFSIISKIKMEFASKSKLMMIFLSHPSVHYLYSSIMSIGALET